MRKLKMVYFFICLCVCVPDGFDGKSHVYVSAEGEGFSGILGFD